MSKTYNIDIRKGSNCCPTDKEIVKALNKLGPIFNENNDPITNFRARIESASYNANSGVLTLTRDDNTVINVLLSQNSTAIYESALDDSTTMSEDVGGIPSGTTVADLDGDTISSILDSLLFPATSPTASLSGSGNKTIEVGTTINPELTGTFNQGSAGAQTAVSLERNSTEIATQNPYTDTGLTSATPQTFTYQMIFDYDADVLPAGTINTNTVSYNFIYPIFYGTSADGNVDAADIIAGTKVVSSDTTPTVTFNSNSSEYSWIAVPASFATFTNWFITALNQGGIGPGETFGNPTTLQVTTSEWSNIDYELYVTNFSTEITEPLTFS